MRSLGLAFLMLLVPALAAADDFQNAAACAGDPCSGLPVYAAAPPPPAALQPLAARTKIRVVPPPFGSVFIDDGTSFIGSFSAPGSLAVPTGRSYGVTAMRGSDVLWSARVMAEGGEVELVWKRRGVAPKILRRTSPPPPPAVVLFAPSAPSPMAAPTFSALLAAVEGESFESDKLSVIKAAAGHNYFSVAQVGSVIDLLAFDSSRVEVVKALRPRVVDPENGFLLSSHLTFASSKQEAVALFSR